MNLRESERLLQTLNGDFGRPRLAVVGDLMLDHYLLGKVDRISPEAPIPVVHLQREDWVLGGAGNVAANLVGLGAEVTLLGLVGKDEGAGRLAQLAQQRGIVCNLIPTAAPTIIKTRVIGEHQHIVRLDREEIFSPGHQGHEDALFEQLEAVLDTLDAVVLSDYAKGTLSPAMCRRIITACRERGVHVIVDPKGRDFSKYRRATCITPNIKELLLATGVSPASETDLIEAARSLAVEQELNFVLLTRGAQGLSYVSAQETLHARAVAKTVYDVSGAGDTVVAVLTMLLLGGFDWTDILTVANLAASVVISKTGTAPISAAELRQELREADAVHLPSSRKIKDRDEIWSVLEPVRQAGRKIVFTNGCFDILHIGHVRTLEQARDKGDVLVVGVNADASVKRLKGETRPINREQDRALLLAALEAVDFVVVFEEDTPLELIQKIEPDVLVKGGDYTLEAIVGAELVLARGGQVQTVSYENGYSTTNLISALKES